VGSDTTEPHAVFILAALQIAGAFLKLTSPTLQARRREI
jgi:hypothetical protein